MSKLVFVPMVLLEGIRWLISAQTTRGGRSIYDESSVTLNVREDLVDGVVDVP